MVNKSKSMKYKLRHIIEVLKKSKNAVETLNEWRYNIEGYAIPLLVLANALFIARQRMGNHSTWKNYVKFSNMKIYHGSVYFQSGRSLFKYDGHKLTTTKIMHNEHKLSLIHDYAFQQYTNNIVTLCYNTQYVVLNIYDEDLKFLYQTKADLIGSNFYYNVYDEISKFVYQTKTTLSNSNFYNASLNLQLIVDQGIIVHNTYNAYAFDERGNQITVTISCFGNILLDPKHHKLFTKKQIYFGITKPSFEALYYLEYEIVAI